MSEYVSISSSPAELMGIATQISKRGEELRTRAQALTEAIKAHDNRAECYPSDQFSDPFDAQYNKPTTATDGNQHPAPYALQQSAIYLGTRLGQIGDFIGSAMMNYGATDDQSATEIRKSGTDA